LSIRGKLLMLDEALASIYKVKTLCLKPQSARP